AGGDPAVGAPPAGGREGTHVVAELPEPVAQVPDVLGHAPGVAVVIRRDERDLHVLSVTRPRENRRRAPWPRPAARAGGAPARSGAGRATGPGARGSAPRASSPARRSPA